MRKNKPIAQINILPFVDVVLVILVFFMISINVSTPKQRFAIDLPKVTSQEADKTDQAHWILVLDKNAKIFLESGPKSYQGEQIKEELLVNFIKKNRPKSNNFSIYLKADKSLMYEEVLKLMSQIYTAGIYRVGLVTDKPQ